MFTKLFFANLLFFIALSSTAQQVKISDSSTLTSWIANSSALLELASSNKGLLLPRMSTAQMDAIVNPSKGLLIFNISDSVFYMKLDSGWTKLATGINEWGQNGLNIFSLNTGNVGIGTNNPTQKLTIAGNIKVDNSIYLPNTDSLQQGVIYKNGLPFLHNAGVTMSNVYLGTNAGSFHPLAKKNVAIGEGALQASDGADNVAIGWMAAHILNGGSSYTESFKNTFVGYLSGLYATGGINNVSLGEESGSHLAAGSSGNVLLGSGAGYYVTTGAGNCLVGNNVQSSTASFNTGIGGNSGVSTTSGSYNSWLGAGSLASNKIGWYNTALGAFAQNTDTSGGWFNVYVGAFSGLYTQGANNVFIGAYSGYNDLRFISNRLIINNNTDSKHLINGKFDLKKVGINTTLDDLNYTLDVGGEIRIGSLTAAPSPNANGVIYYNSSNNKFVGYENGSWKNIITENKIFSKSSDPTSADVQDSYFSIWKNTTSGNVYLWVNDGGVMKKVQLQ